MTPNPRLQTPGSTVRPLPLHSSLINFNTFSDQTVDDFEIIDLPVLGLTNQVGEILRDIVAVSQLHHCSYILKPSSLKFNFYD